MGVKGTASQLWGLDLRENKAIKAATGGSSQVKFNQITLRLAYHGNQDNIKGALCASPEEYSSNASIEELVARGARINALSSPIGYQCAGRKEWTPLSKQPGAVYVWTNTVIAKDVAIGVVTGVVQISVRGYGNFT